MRNHKGSAVIFVAVAMVVLLGMAALAVDLGYLYVVKGELQNAADSGALAGAQVLYNDAGTSVNAGANAMAQSYVQQNYSEKAQVTVLSVERGHWAFSSHTFTPNNSLDPVDLWNVTADELDANTDFINAVKVVTRRKRDSGNLPAPFFAQVLGAAPSEVTATAVAYIGFAGKLKPTELDQPIAICKQAITVNNTYRCDVGRFINSGGNPAHESGGWTNFSQPCVTANPSNVPGLICASGNPNLLTYGAGMGTVNGMQTSVFNPLRACWLSHADSDGDGIADQPWVITLPVIDCPGNSVGNCSTLVGAVTVTVVWITESGVGQITVPRRMGGWTCPVGSTDAQCWTSFVSYFNLTDVQGDQSFLANPEQKTLYFLPACDGQGPSGVTGGENFGVLAKIPVLVK
jgi:hypothetical protein